MMERWLSGGEGVNYGQEAGHCAGCSSGYWSPGGSCTDSCTGDLWYSGQVYTRPSPPPATGPALTTATGAGQHQAPAP